MKTKLLTFFSFCFLNINYSQEINFSLSNNIFKITQNEIVVYNDSVNLAKGSCNDIQIIKSDYKNQFFLYIENNCTSTITKQLFKINWHENKFLILNKEIIKQKQNSISCKTIYYDNYKLDSLLIETLDVEENKLTNNVNKKNNKIPVFYESKLIGYKSLSTDKLVYNYPIIDTYDKIDNLNLYNDIGFILYKNKSFDESIYILNKVIEKSPNRVVTYLNIADCYWELNEKEKAKENYLKYIQLMKDQKKNLKKIPKYVFERIK